MKRISIDRAESLPAYLNTTEVATLLRTSRKAIYAMIERRQLPGVTRIGRRVLIHERSLLQWLQNQRDVSSQGEQR